MLLQLLSKSTLYEAAAATHGARSIDGRGTAYAIATTQGEWLVRHYRRGGALAPLLGDRYLRTPEPRAFRELRVSVVARAAGIATPEVIAAVCYTGGLVVRYDIAVQFIANAFDLAAVLFKQTGLHIDREVPKAVALIRQICERGLIHVDLNLKNILLGPAAGYVVDLDRCRMSEPSKAAAAAMRARFVRSLEKWQKRTGITVAPATRAQLEEAFHVA